MTLRNNHIHIITLLTLAITGSVQAQDSSEQDELNQFMELLEQQTSLATKSRLNADFVPGMLSVLTAEQMQRRGSSLAHSGLGRARALVRLRP